MPIDSKHPLYTSNIDTWAKCRLAYMGEDAVKAAAETLLPKLSGQSRAEYDAYVMRALYYEAVPRTIDGFVGAISRKPHTIVLPTKLDLLNEDVTADGIGLHEIIKKLCAEVMLVARAGVLVDYDDTLQRAFLSVYPAEAIINWAPGSIVLQEVVYQTADDDPFCQVAVDQIRQLHLIDGRYTVTLWRKVAGTPVASQWQIYEETTPNQRGTPLDEVPFFWLSPMGQTASVQKPPLLGLVNVSFSHYRTSADLEHGRHWTALPTLWIAGAQPDQEIRVGAAAAIVLADPGAKVGYAEFTGAGLGSLENALDAKENQMAVLGAAIFSQQRKGVEAAETARIRTSAENSLLMGIVSAVEETLNGALKVAAEWMAAPGEVKVTLNRDFIDVTLDPHTLLSMVAAFQAGAMTIDAFIYCLQQSEMLPPGATIEGEIAKLKAAKAPVPGQIAPPIPTP